MRKKPKHSFLPHFLRKKSFYDSQELRYIDEDSDDEMVNHLGRPPSIHFSDAKLGKKPSFLERLRRSLSNRSAGEESNKDVVMERLSRTSEDAVGKDDVGNPLSRTPEDEVGKDDVGNPLSRTSEDEVGKDDVGNPLSRTSGDEVGNDHVGNQLSRTSDEEVEQIETDPYV